MSTNFFAVLPAHDGACAHCSRPTQYHVGKRYGIGNGQTAFTYQALRAQDSPTGHPIVCVADWRSALESPNVTIEDEYGSPVTVEEFFEIAINPRAFLWEWFE
jgi:hypothetical protein